MSNQVETIIEYQLEGRNKTTVFWRGILVVPAAIFLYSFYQMSDYGSWTSGFLVLPALLALLVRGIYPSYVLSFNHALFELSTRLTAYIFLLTDDYPSIERNPKIAILLPDVEGGKKLNRWLPLVKWILAIPLYIVGIAYAFVALVLTFFAWIATWSTGRYPTWALDIVLGTVKFWNRVYGYTLLLVTDEYPSFSLN
jgi:hypothetical protein